MGSQTSITFGPLRDRIEQAREKGTSMAAYVRESVRLRMELENAEELIQEHGLSDDEAE